MSERWLQADGLAAKSSSLLDQPQVALLLAAQASAFQRAAGEEVAPSVEGALHRVLGATGGTVVPLPQAGDGPYAVAMSGDGRLAVDAEPGVVQVWNPEQIRQARRSGWKVTRAPSVGWRLRRMGRRLSASTTPARCAPGI